MRQSSSPVAPADSDLSAEHEVIAELRVVLSITDDHLVGRGYAAELHDDERRARLMGHAACVGASRHERQRPTGHGLDV